MAHISAAWTSPTGSQCVATGSGGHTVVMDAPGGRPEWAGFKPSELVLAALAGCVGVDFTGILAKQRQHVTVISADVEGQQDADPPWAFRRIALEFTVRGQDLDVRAVNRALDLAVSRYCSVGASLAGAVAITHSLLIQPEPTLSPGATAADASAGVAARDGDSPLTLGCASGNQTPTQ